MNTPDIRNKDYISIDNKLYFAVVSDDIEQDKVLSWLRYVKTETGLQKLNTQEASTYIQTNYPELVFHSLLADNVLHGIPLKQIGYIFSSKNFLPILKHLPKPDKKQIDALTVIKLLEQCDIDSQYLGITGSLLINAQTDKSDIDLLVYGREQFFKVRACVKQLLNDKCFLPLDENDWRNTYQRRNCGVDFETYCFHERRKFNKFKIGETKVDISMIPDRQEQVQSNEQYSKSGLVNIQSTVTNDQYAYDNPARYYLDHEQIQEVVVYTATYVGQAKKNERIEVSGILEVAGNKKRLVVGTSREAKQEYIKIIP